MELARSILGVGGQHDGYSKGAPIADTLSEDEDEPEVSEAVSVRASVFGRNSGYSPSPGGPFSALIPSMWPLDLFASFAQPEDVGCHHECRYDEFGFRLEDEHSPHRKRQASSFTNRIGSVDGTTSGNNDSNDSASPLEIATHRDEWIGYLEFAHSDNTNAELTWHQIDRYLDKTDRLCTMITKKGIPHSLRPQLWMRLSGAFRKRDTSDLNYHDIVKASAGDHQMTSKQIEKDLLRTLPNNICFAKKDSTGIPRLRRILRGIAWLYPDIGYCQGMGMVAGTLLLFLEEEDAFWLLCTIIEDLLPPSYFATTLLGVQADQKVLRALIDTELPQLHALLLEHDIELSLITLQWFLTAFASVLNTRCLLRIWDLFFFHGSILLFQVTLAILHSKESELANLENSAEIFNALSALPGELESSKLEELISSSQKFELYQENIDQLRRKHLAYLMADQGVLLNPESVHNLPKQHLTKRQLKRGKSVVQVILGTATNAMNEESRDELVRTKNIKQTEILVDLREAILQIARHFTSLDPKLKINLTADYSMESHAKDHQQFTIAIGNRQKRAKALLDFERSDNDELGFKKNDIITVVSQKDEHCWIGELNGCRGWFPAKFVKLLDERSKPYSLAGDDTVTEAITDLARGVLCPAIKAVLEYGMRRPSFGQLSISPQHPWQFIEEAASRQVEKDLDSVYSRLVLCKTFRLDEDGKVLSPEELLFRSVQTINVTHDAAQAALDVKLRTLVCLGLNEQLLHLWFEVLCSRVDVVHKWYHPWSFVNSPGWVQIKCELRLLNQFSFNLSPDWELPNKTPPSQEPLREGVRDMLVKHHLFSWDL
ncbi:small G protein signaling modulator 3-like [Varroa jacobsoni]|uniref:RUN and TBC1 domain-containing protein 3 n=1 Tax=Varroa destructor TaxID=109461 RepID=A0A7M7KXL3_VARDE|nr:small G protein signaling modulator 3-like isoform X1 [Varroa destructor]XP_022687673.1 small G protein signaling modulator 3-like [Varroa jacobsoni]